MACYVTFPWGESWRGEHEWVTELQIIIIANTQFKTATNSQTSPTFKVLKNSCASSDLRSTLTKTFTNRPCFWNFLMVWADATPTAGYTETVLKTLERVQVPLCSLCVYLKEIRNTDPKECIRNQYWESKSETTNWIIFVQAYLLATSYCILSNEEPGIALIAICRKKAFVSQLFTKRAEHFQWHDTATALIRLNGTVQ